MTEFPSPSEQTLLRLVAGAAFANPFAPERVELDRALANAALPPAEARPPEYGPESPAGGRVLARALERLEGQIAVWRGQGRAKVGAFPAAWREAAELMFLFVVFHRHSGRFDGLIAAQEAAGDKPSAAPFVPALLAELEGFGFSRADALKYAGLFYQLRRAFHFISTGLVGSSPCMDGLRRRLWGNVFTGDMRWYVRHLWDRMEDYSTLLTGETGTGKGAAAAALGKSGYIPFDEKSGAFVESFTRAFVPLNLAECPPALLESELFGHRKGAFTGALEDHDGVFARCSPHGAIFLDEIGDAAPATQVKLLRVLQDRVFAPVGGRSTRRFSGRVIAATHVDLDRARAEGRFREDFYYRLCSDLIEVPPLRVRFRENPAERDELTSVLLHRLTGRRDADLVAHVRQALIRDVPAEHPWPGNVRELEQAVRRILLTGSYHPSAAAGRPATRALALANRMLQGSLDAESLLSEYCGLLYEQDARYTEVARITGLDRRTVKRHLTGA